jgi:putative glutamine amidotransferase
MPAYPVAPTRVERWADAGIAVPEPYVAAVQRAGGQEAILAPRPLAGDEAHALLAHFAGLLLIGGPDLDPQTYGQEPDPHVYGLSAVRDEFELALCRAAVEADLPILAICRGAQLLNVARGGSLHQHISDDFPGHGRPGVEGGQQVHAVGVEPGSRTAAVMGEATVRASCHHHQAIDRIGEGLVVSARSPDGIVEGLELPAAGWLVALQWHPEDTAAHDPVQQRLFDAFVVECEARR